MWSSAVQQRRRVKQASPLDQRLTDQAQRLEKRREAPRPALSANGFSAERDRLKRLPTWSNGLHLPACARRSENFSRRRLAPCCLQASTLELSTASSACDPQQKCFLGRTFRFQSRRSQRKRGHEQQGARADDCRQKRSIGVNKRISAARSPGTGGCASVLIDRGNLPNSKLVTPNTRCSRNGGIAPVYMRAVSNTGASPKSCASATASRLIAGNVQKNLAAARLASKADKTASAAGAIVGHQRADLKTLPARTDHAPAGKPAIAHQRAADMSGRANPGPKERGSRRRKHRGVARLHVANGTSVSAMNACGAARRRNGAAVTDIGVSELQSRTFW